MNPDLYDEPREGSETLLHNVVYCSRITSGLAEADVQAIIATARRYNPAHGVTGLLVYGGDIFFQWLEGPKKSVEQLMHNIRKDKRHNTLVELSVNEEVRERMFPTWDMELVQPDDIREVLQDALRDAKAAVNTKALRELMQRVEEAELP